jgi:hypothetical protein
MIDQSLINKLRGRKVAQPFKDSDKPTKVLLIMGRQSRFDLANNSILAGPSYYFVKSVMKSQGIDIDNPEQFVAEFAGSPFESLLFKHNPSHIIVAGECLYLKQLTMDEHLDNIRGHIYLRGSFRLVFTYHPQDCVDEYAKDRMVLEAGEELDEDDSVDKSEFKDKCNTNRLNYRFWFKSDIAKAFWPLEKLTADYSPSKKLTSDGITYFLLNGGQSKYLYLDIETHPSTNTIQCFSIAFDTGPVAGYIVYGHDGKAKGNNAKVFAALARAFMSHSVVAHNASFDLSFLSVYHGMPIPLKAEDTMLMWHRMHREAEKSLAHVMSGLTNLPYHKDESGTFEPVNAFQQEKLLAYNIKDVDGLRRIHQAMWAEAQGGLRTSLEQVNASISVYLKASLLSFELDSAALNAVLTDLRAKLAQIERLISLCVGYKLNPSSALQVRRYLFMELGYKPLQRTESGEAQVDLTTLYALRIKHPRNPVIHLIILCRDMVKRIGTLNFSPFFYPEART